MFIHSALDSFKAFLNQIQPLKIWRVELKTRLKELKEKKISLILGFCEFVL